MQLRDLDPHLHAQRRIEVGQRLVEQEHARVAHDRPADRHALALAARELLGLALEQVLDLQDARGVAHPLVDALLADLRELQAERHVVVHAHVRIERVGLEHHGDAALGRGELVDHLAVESISPEVMSSSPAIRRSRVDLPQPDGPTKTTNSLFLISRLTPLITSA